VNKKFSTRYYLNLVLVDEENRRYFKQQEITIFRIPEVRCSVDSYIHSYMMQERDPSGAIVQGYKMLTSATELADISETVFEGRGVGGGGREVGARVVYSCYSESISVVYAPQYTLGWEQRCG
jgi:hypothetical protein